jgi:hypothetical protein
MKIKKKELDVDFIGGQDPLTPEEEKALSVFFKKQLLVQHKQITGRLSIKKRNKTSV